MATTVDYSTKQDRIAPVNFGERGMGCVVARKFTHADFAASGDTIKLIPIPANSFIKHAVVLITTAFDDTPTLTVGDGDDPNGYLQAIDIDATDVELIGDTGCVDSLAAYLLKLARPFYLAADTLDITKTDAASPTAGEGVLIAEIVTVPR